MAEFEHTDDEQDAHLSRLRLQEVRYRVLRKVMGRHDITYHFDAPEPIRKVGISEPTIRSYLHFVGKDAEGTPYAFITPQEAFTWVECDKAPEAYRALKDSYHRFILGSVAYKQYIREFINTCNDHPGELGQLRLPVPIGEPYYIEPLESFVGLDIVAVDPLPADN